MKKIMSVLIMFTMMFTSSCVFAESTPQININGYNITVTNAEADSTLIAAFYKNEILVSVGAYQGGTTINADISDKAKNADMVKAFLWDMESIKPLCNAVKIDAGTEDDKQESKIYIKANGVTFDVKLSDNSSAEALVELLKQKDITITMNDYGNFEKVGALGATLPRNDEQITTGPGDVILNQGNQITIYYDTNSWNFTRLGKIENITKEELLEVFGAGDVTVVLSLSD